MDSWTSPSELAPSPKYTMTAALAPGWPVPTGDGVGGRELLVPLDAHGVAHRVGGLGRQDQRVEVKLVSLGFQPPLETPRNWRSSSARSTLRVRATPCSR